MSAPPAAPPPGREGGFVMMCLLLGLVGAVLALAAGLTMFDQGQGLPAQVAAFAAARARSAAESGLEDALFVANSSSGLGGGVTRTRNLGDGRSVTYVTVLLRSDGLDNDGDGAADEPDEDLLRVTATGTCDGATVVLRMHLSPVSGGGALAAPQSSFTMMNDGALVDFKGAAATSGLNYNIDGTRGSSSYDRHGMVVEPPDTAGDLAAMVPSADHGKVTGLGAAPSFGVATATTDLLAVKTSVQSAATTTYTPGTRNNASFGDGSTGAWQATYVSGNVEFRGNSRGAGVLYVAGDLRTQGSFRFDGIIYVEGTVELDGNSTVYGALVIGPSSSAMHLDGSALVRYSQAAVGSAVSVSGLGGSVRYTGFTGWADVTP